MPYKPKPVWETSIINVISNDDQLVKAMRASDCVKAYFIGLIMSSLYKQAYRALKVMDKNQTSLINPEEMKVSIKSLISRLC